MLYNKTKKTREAKIIIFTNIKTNIKVELSSLHDLFQLFLFYMARMAKLPK